MIDKKNIESDYYVLGIGFLGFLLIFPIGGLLADSQSVYAPLAIWSGLVFLLYYIFLFVGENPFVKRISAQTGSKVAFGIISLLITIESTRLAAISINNVFGIDASAFPSTLLVSSILNTLVFSKPFVLSFAIWGTLTFFGYFVFLFTDKFKTFKWSVFFLAISGMLVGWTGYILIGNNEGEVINKKIYAIAHSFDFNSNVVCQNKKLNGAGVFLGPEQKLVFFDSSSNDIPVWYDAVIFHEKKLDKVIIPTMFNRIECK